MKSLRFSLLLLTLLSLQTAWSDIKTMQLDKLGTLTVQTDEVGEPVSTPARLTITLTCLNQKKVVLQQKKPICLIAKMEVRSKTLIIHHQEYDPNEGQCSHPYEQKISLEQRCK